MVAVQKEKTDLSRNKVQSSLVEILVKEPRPNSKPSRTASRRDDELDNKVDTTKNPIITRDKSEIVRNLEFYSLNHCKTE